MNAPFDVDAVIARLTLEEKAALLSGSGFWHTEAVGHLGVPSVLMTDGPHGVRLEAAGGAGPALSGSIPATCFPTGSGLGSTWNPVLIRSVGEALGRECAALGVGLLLGPGVNIKRTPLCGRNFEYFSEDPLLAGTLASAWVEGVQSQGIGASLKHFAANNQETERMRVSAQIDERTLREIYLAAFEPVVRTARPWTVMCSYNRVNGTYASENDWLLTRVLRDEWGFAGTVVSDWGAVHDPVKAVAAGLDLEMPGTGESSPGVIAAAVREGRLEEGVVDRAVARNLALVRLVQAAAALRDILGGTVGTDDRAIPADLADAHHDLARRVARETAVLLKNEGGLLPLSPEQGGTVAVIGEFARTPRFQGGGSSKVNPLRLDTALAAISELIGGRRALVFEPGYAVDDADADAATGTADVAAAIAAAAEAQDVVLFLGVPPAEESEGFDRAHLDLPAAQVDLLRAVSAVNHRVVVVLANGGVVGTAAWDGRAPAVLEGWLGGQAGGGAIADLLFGVANPSGRLAETIPLKLTDTPAYLNYPGTAESVLYGERVYVGYRYYDTLDRAVAYPFGHGLSYTTFEYADLAVATSIASGTGAADAADATGAGDAVAVATDFIGGSLGGADQVEVSVSATIRNTGGRAGQEVVQLYVADPLSSVDRPARELRAFTKIALAPGESATVRFTLTDRAFSFYSERLGRWLLESGEFVLSLGSSSRDLRLTETIRLVVAQPREVLSVESTIGEWLAHPVGGPALRELAATLGPEAVAAFEEPTLGMVKGMSLASFLAMAPVDLPAGIPDDLVAVANGGSAA